MEAVRLGRRDCEKGDKGSVRFGGHTSSNPRFMWFRVAMRSVAEYLNEDPTASKNLSF
jgi:hypothetical protein